MGRANDPNELFADCADDEQSSSTRRLTEHVEPGLAPRMRHVRRRDERLIEEDLLALEPAHTMPLPTLVGVAFVPLEPDACAESLDEARHAECI